MVICPRCKTAIRSGDIIRAIIIGEFVRMELDAHRIEAYNDGEEQIEHYSCRPEAWESRAVKWLKRRLGWAA